MRKLLLLALFLAAAEARADFWTGDFPITNLYVSLGENFHYRIYGMPARAECPNGSTWAYVNESDSGSKGQIAALLTAYAMGKQVRLYVVPTNGYCHLLEIFTSG